MLKKNEFMFSESIFTKVLLILDKMPSAIFVHPFLYPFDKIEI